MFETADQNNKGETLKQKVKTDIFASFYIGETEMAVSVNSIQEVVNFPERIVKMPLSPDFLYGIFNLRGLIIPIINLKALLKYNDQSVSSSQKIGIVEHQGAKVGLLFDSTSEIIRVHQADINEFTYGKDHAHKVIAGAIKLNDGERILQIIDPFALINIDNIPQILEKQLRTKKENALFGRLENRKKCISFIVQGALMGLEMTGIHEIIKIDEVKPSPIESDLCLGLINIRSHLVPIINLAAILGMGSSSQSLKEGRVIVLKINNELFGLLVDSVESITPYAEDQILPIPLINNKRSKMFLGCISTLDKDEIILLNYQEVLQNDEILEITQGHSSMYGASKDDIKLVQKKMNREAYVSFKLDHLFAVSIKEIQEVINYSEEIVSVPGMPSFVRGVLNLRERLVTIVDTRSLYCLPNESYVKDTAKILIFNDGQERFGLIVDSIQSIMTIDESSKMAVPHLLMADMKGRFEKDIKEIISIEDEEHKKDLLIILNVGTVRERIRTQKAA